MRFAVLLLLAATLAAPASLALLPQDPVEAPAAGPGTGLRYAERFQAGDGWEETTRIVTVGDADMVGDARGLDREAVPVTVQRRADGDVLGAQRCWASPDAATSVRREPLASSPLESPMERAWGLAGDAAPDAPDAFDRVTPSWPAEETAARFEPHPCPARGPGTTLDLEGSSSGPLAKLLPAGLPVGPKADVDGAASLEPAAFHGRPARWANATFHLRLPGPLPAPGGQAPGPLLVDGRTATLWADGLPGPARRTVDLSLHAPHAPAYDRDVAWEVEVTGHQAGETAELGPATGSTGSADGEAWTDRGPTTGAYEVKFPLERAVDALDERGARYQVYRLRHPDAYVRSATYDTEASPAPLDRVDGPGWVRGPAWTVSFTSPDGHAYRGTVLAAGSDGGGSRGSSAALGEPNASSQTHVWESPADASREAQPAPALERIPALAPRDEVRGAVDGLGFPDGPLDRLAFEAHAPQAGAGVQVTVELAATYRSPAGAVQEAVQALVDGETGRVLAVTESSPDDGGTPLPDPIPATFSGDGAGTEGASAAPLPDGPAAGVGLAAGAGLLALLLGLKSLLSPLFTRIGRDEVLENPTRRELLEAVEEDPGVHLAELIDRAGLGNGATRHHLEKLEEASLLRVVRHGGYVRFFPAGEFTEAEARQRAALRSGSNREVYEAYRETPEASIRDLARRLDMSSSGVHRALRMLREVGLVDE